jgi:hypothetical protein
MMTFLAWVTVVYALVLVVVLAVSLITILYYLWSIGTTLAKIGAGLGVVRQQTAPLGGHITAINGALESVRDGLSGALDDLAHTNAALGTVVGEPPAAVEHVA